MPAQSRLAGPGEGRDEARSRARLGKAKGKSYWTSFRNAWLLEKGQASFRIQRERLLQKKKIDRTVYYCLWVEPVGHIFPVIRPHISLGKFAWKSNLQNWKATLKCQALLWPREVKAEFLAYGPSNFKLMEGNEMFALVALLREELVKESGWALEVDRVPHISWTPL